MKLKLTDEIERVQKSAYYIIFGPNSYKNTLKNSKTHSLDHRRTQLSNKFAKQCTTSQQFSTWFQKKPHLVNTRNPHTYKEVPARCDRWMTSPIPHMTRFLNNH